MSVYSDDDGGMDDSFDSEAGFASGDDALLDDEVSRRCDPLSLASIRIHLTRASRSRQDDYAPTSAQDKEVTHDIPYESLSSQQLQKLIEDDISHVAAIVGKHVRPVHPSIEPRVDQLHVQRRHLLWRL